MMALPEIGAWQSLKFQLSDGDRGIAETIDAIRALVDQGITDPRVRRVATEILRNSGVPQYDEIGEVRAVFDWARNPANLRFTKDMVGKEMLQPAWSVLESGAGDCDCINAIVLPSLLGAIGYPTRAVTVAADLEDPETFSHIYIEALAEDAAGNLIWIPLDVARPNAAWLRTPERFSRIKRWPLMEAAEIEAPVGGGMRYLNGIAAVHPAFRQPVIVAVRRSRLPRFGLGQDDGGISASDIEALLGPEAGPSATSPMPSTPEPIMTPVIISSGPSSTYQAPAPSGPSIAQQLTPIFQAVPGIETGAAQIVAASNLPSYGTRVPSTSMYPQSGTAVITASTGGSSIFVLLLLGLGLLVIVPSFRR